jgi:hypothetical protein
VRLCGGGLGVLLLVATATTALAGITATGVD